MAITFTYDESTNTVVQTEGTSGTPATFANFVTADRAGTEELTPEDTPDACTTNMTLTYQIRPVEKLALQITFTLAGTSAGAGDTLDVTGTDWDGNAQGPESIDVSGGDGAYTGANQWRTITDIDCTGWADGTLQVTQPQWGVIWDYGNRNYRVDAILNFGDGSTSTYFRSIREEVLFTKTPVGFNNAECKVGDLVNGYGTDGSSWRFLLDGNVVDQSQWFPSGSWFKLYASRLFLEAATSSSYYIFRIRGNTDIRQSTIEAARGGSYENRALIFLYGSSTVVSGQVYFTGWDKLVIIYPILTLNDLHVNNANWGIYRYADGVVTASGMLFTNMKAGDIQMGNYQYPTLIVQNPVNPISTVMIEGNNSQPKEGYTCNIHVTDKDGVSLSGASVLIEDQYNRTVSYGDSGTDLAEYIDVSETGVDVDDGTKFSAGQYILIDAEWMLIGSISTNTLTVTRGQYNGQGGTHANGSDIYIAQAIETDAGGDITEQDLIYRSWLTTSETITIHSPHKFTFSHADYPALIFEDVTVDAPINWRIDMGQSDSDLTALMATALATYDGPTKTEMDTGHGLLATEAKQDVIDTTADAILVDTGTTIPALIASLNDITVANIFDGVIEGTHTLQDVMKFLLTRAAGKATGGGTTSITFRDTGDGTDRIVMTVDSAGNRSAVVLDAS